MYFFTLSKNKQLGNLLEVQFDFKCHYTKRFFPHFVAKKWTKRWNLNWIGVLWRISAALETFNQRHLNPHMAPPGIIRSGSARPSWGGWTDFYSIPATRWLRTKGQSNMWVNIQTMLCSMQTGTRIVDLIWKSEKPTTEMVSDLEPGLSSCPIKASCLCRRASGGSRLQPSPSLAWLWVSAIQLPPSGSNWPCGAARPQHGLPQCTALPNDTHREAETVFFSNQVFWMMLEQSNSHGSFFCFFFSSKCFGSSNKRH